MRIRAAVTDVPGGPFVVRDVDLEAPRPHEVLVKITAAGMCHTDLSSPPLRRTGTGMLEVNVAGTANSLRAFLPDLQRWLIDRWTRLV